MLCKILATKPSHEHIERQLHKTYGRHPLFPRRYIKLHTILHNQRSEFNYRTTHSPDPDNLRTQLKQLISYVRFALKVVPRVEVYDLLKSLSEDNPERVKDFSFDIYCPRTYKHHTRLTLWQPPFYLDIFGVSQVVNGAVRMLRGLRVRKSRDYVVGLNSRVNQYKDDHLIMLDIDAVDPAVEAALKPIGGILLKSGRGFHFISRNVVSGLAKWRKEMRSLTRHKTLKLHVDKEHIDISLQRGYATLRVTASPVKPVTPYFYKEF